MPTPSASIHMDYYVFNEGIKHRLRATKFNNQLQVKV